MNNADERVLAHLKFDVPFTDEDYRLLGDCSAVGQAGLLFATDETALLEWYERPNDSPTSITRVLSRAVDRGDVADRIDESLLEDPTILADLVRARVMWTHPQMATLLDRAEFRTAAVWHLVHNDPEPLADWLEQEHSIAQVGAVARDVAFSDGLEFFDLLAEWMGAVEDDAGRWVSKLEAALFSLSPTQWARGYLAGMWNGEFMEDWVAMADIGSVAPPSYWNAPLAALRKHPDEFALVARLAAAGASATLSMVTDESLEMIVEAFDAEKWSSLSRHPLFSTTLALADDEDLQVPLLESATHDVLSAAGIESPGIAGLPLSPRVPADEALAEARRLLEAFEESDDMLIPVVATLCDIVELRANGDERTASLDEAVSAIAESEHGAAELARSVLSPPSIDELARLADGTGIENLVATEHLSLRTLGRGPVELINLWADGPLLRSTLYSTLVQANLTSITLS